MKTRQSGNWPRASRPGTVSLSTVRLWRESGPAPASPTRPVSAFQYAFCGVIQLLVFLSYMIYTAWILVFGYEWTLGGTTLLDMWLRTMAFGAAVFVVLSVTPIIAKWVLVGRWKPGSIRIWSVAYLRFWVVKTLTRANPLALFVGSPIDVVYLRLLGAKIGKGVVIFERHVPACPDLLTVGDNTVIHKNTIWILCYRAHAGNIMMGPVTLGRNVLVSERCRPGHRNVDGRRQPARTCVIAADGRVRPPGRGMARFPCRAGQRQLQARPGRPVQHPPEGHL